MCHSSASSFSAVQENSRHWLHLKLIDILCRFWSETLEETWHLMKGTHPQTCPKLAMKARKPPQQILRSRWQLLHFHLAYGFHIGLADLHVLSSVSPLCVSVSLLRSLSFSLTQCVRASVCMRVSWSRAVGQPIWRRLWVMIVAPPPIKPN